jgi:hypothetical protein
MIPIAAFLAGALLSLLLPISLLVAIVVWYTKFVRRVPEPEAPSAAEAPVTTVTECDTPGHA